MDAAAIGVSVSSGCSFTVERRALAVPVVPPPMKPALNRRLGSGFGTLRVDDL